VGITLINQPLHLMGKVFHRPLRGHGNMPPPGLHGKRASSAMKTEELHQVEN
jgi:hypothetical protein